MTAFPAGDRIATAHAVFDGLWDRHHAAVFRYCCHLTDPHRGADVTQDVFLDAFRALLEGRFDGQHERAWLFRNASRKCIDSRLYGWRRYVRASAERLFPEFFVSRSVDARRRPDGREDGARQRAGEEALTAPPRWADPATVCADRDEAAGVAALVGRLPAAYRAALWLRAWEGLDYDEIGAALGTTRAGTKALLFRARTRLRAEWQRRGAAA